MSMVAEAQEQREQMIADARELVSIQLAEAREQSEWTKQTVGELLAAAEADAEQTRNAAIEFSDRHHERARLRVAEAIEAGRAQLVTDEQQHQFARDERNRQSEAALSAAIGEADRIRNEADAAARELVATAEERFNATDKRAKRRLAEAEAGARTVRETAAEHLAHVQDEAREEKRRARDEATRVVTLAKAEADEMRAIARDILAEARAEVAVLHNQRDEISKQLGDLSGVIDALAVAERPEASR
jgi:hypothetical protein